MSTRPDPELIDDEIPELDDAWFARARPAREVLPDIFGAETAARMLRPRGRPKSAAPKEKINVRLSPQVLSAFRATGKGWQTRIDAVLQEAVAQGRVQAFMSHAACAGAPSSGGARS